LLTGTAAAALVAPAVALAMVPAAPDQDDELIALGRGR
jgi:hypothetical protein